MSFFNEEYRKKEKKRIKCRKNEQNMYE